MRKQCYSFIRLIVILTVTQVIFASAALAAVIYVASGAGGSNDGTSWTHAYTNLQTAITSSTSGDELWVKAGTYIPSSAPNYTTPPPGANYYHFHLKNGVALYGGFSGIESNVTERDISANPTILSGNNARYNVIYHDYSPLFVNSSAVLDGFTVTASTQAALQLINSSPTIRNCTFSNNKASAIKTKPSTSHMYINDCTFVSNSNFRGGAMYINGYFGKKVYITNCTFKSNSASNAGGAIYSAYAGAKVMNSTFTGNTAPNGRTICTDYSGESTITNSILWNGTNEIYNMSTSTASITYSVVTGGYTGDGNLDTDPAFDPAGLQNNGGPVQTIAILDTGSAFNTGTATGAPATDARGISRPQGREYDMGAFEIEVIGFPWTMFMPVMTGMDKE